MHIFDPFAWTILAEAADNSPGIIGLLPMFIVIGLLFYFMFAVPQKREQQKLKEMLGNLKKNDRVVTAGGIYGTVVNVQQDSPHVTIRVDETTNTKLRVMRSSISRVVTGDEADESNEKKL